MFIEATFKDESGILKFMTNPPCTKDSFKSIIPPPPPNEVMHEVGQEVYG